MAPTAPPGPAPEPARPPCATPLAQTLLAWTLEHLRPHGASRPLCKRVALLLGGLLAGERATLSAIAAGAQRAGLPPAREPSVLRRVERTLDDVRLDPARLLPDVLASLAPLALRPLLGAPGRGAVRLVVDETSVADRLHVLVLGLALPGLVLPLAVRCWRQNAPLPPGQYWAELSAACWQVQHLLPPALRAGVVLLADRAYGVPRLLDLCHQLGWDVDVRVRGDVRVRLARGAERALRTLAPRPGTAWYGGWLAEQVTALVPDAAAAEAVAAVEVFKKAGWRRCQVVAAWADGQAEPWLVLTTLPARPERLREYALRWAIERLFLAWKSHGWDVEAGRVQAPDRLARLVTALALATWWRLACALPRVEQELAALRAPRRARRGAPRQLPLPWDDRPRRPCRPWLAKYSLLTWGIKALRAVDPGAATPALCWAVPTWPAGTWAAHCAAVAAARAA